MSSEQATLNARRHTPGREGAIPSLRPYQVEAARAMLAAVRARDARTISIQIARQGGKNELSAQIELLLLLACGAGDLIKIAPSLRPQGLISLARLWGRLRQTPLAPHAARHGNTIALGANRLVLLPAGPTSNVLGHTAGALMEVDEAQDIDPERFSRDFRPMGASRATPTVFYGTPWTETSLLEQMKQRHLEQERRDGIRRHFEYDWQTVAAANPQYDRFILEERARLGEHNPVWRTQYCLETVPGSGRLFNPQERALMAGDHPRKRLRDRELLAAPIVAGLDVAGLDVAGATLYRGGDRDHTVLTILQVLPEPSPEPRRPAPEPRLRVLEHIDWPHASHDELLQQLEELLSRTWRPQRFAIDMTGIGEALAAALHARG
ncbi:MAG TPA: hypothetical protein VK821_05875, partial [Dehalococcoidia bacterium]|nr:hypothetical protein [Dehalococcoidia bacterium]